MRLGKYIKNDKDVVKSCVGTGLVPVRGWGVLQLLGFEMTKGIKIRTLTSMFVVTLFITLFLGQKTTWAKIEYVRDGKLPSIRVKVHQIETFSHQLLSVLELAIPDSISHKKPLNISFSTSVSGTEYDATSFSEIYSNPEVPDPIRDLTLSYYNFDDGISKISIRFAAYGNFYSIKGSNKFLVDAIESSIVKFAKENMTWPSYQYIWIYKLILMDIIFLAFLFSKPRTKKMTYIYWAICILLVTIIFLLPTGRFFPPAMIMRGNSGNFFVRHSAEFTFAGFVLAVIALGFTVYYGRRQSKKVTKE